MEETGYGAALRKSVCEFTELTATELHGTYHASYLYSLSGITRKGVDQLSGQPMNIPKG
jgi:uncharacterized protein with LGFP repeats